MLIYFYFSFQRMGNIDDAVPFFGQGFNKIYPLIMVIYTVLVAVDFFGRVIDYFGSWKWFRFRNEEEDMNGFDQSGIIILQKGKLDKFTFVLLLFYVVLLAHPSNHRGRNILECTIKSQPPMPLN